MISPPPILQPWEVIAVRPMPERARIGLVMPITGVLALAGPSALHAALLAAAEVTRAGGFGGRAVDAVVVDAGAPLARVEDDVRLLISTQRVRSFVGLHPSDVLDVIEPLVAGRAQYVFTSGQENRAAVQGVHNLGESSSEVGDAMAWLSREFSAEAWAVVGTDYVWPRAMMEVARSTAASGEFGIVAEHTIRRGFMPREARATVARIASSGADAVLINMPGRDHVHFSAALRSAGLDRRLLRLSGAVEENALYAMSGDDSGRMFGVLRSFVSTQTPRQTEIANRVSALFGQHSPPITSWAEAAYDAVHMLAAWDADPALQVLGTASDPAALARAAASTAWSGVSHPAARQSTLGLAAGLGFDIIDNWSPGDGTDRAPK